LPDLDGKQARHVRNISILIHGIGDAQQVKTQYPFKNEMFLHLKLLEILTAAQHLHNHGIL
jgi:hypothetical protein